MSKKGKDAQISETCAGGNINEKIMPSKSLKVVTASSDVPMAMHVPPHYVFYANMSDKNNIMIATDLASSPNLVIAIYNYETMRAALAHIDMVTDFSSVLGVLDKMRKSENDSLKLIVSGGNRSSLKHFTPLIETIEQIPNVKIVKNDSFPLNKKSAASQCLGIAATGKYYTDQHKLWYFPIHPYKSPQIDKIISCLEAGSTYPLVEVDPMSKDYTPIVVLGDYHPSYYQ